MHPWVYTPLSYCPLPSSICMASCTREAACAPRCQRCVPEPLFSSSLLSPPHLLPPSISASTAAAKVSMPDHDEPYVMPVHGFPRLTSGLMPTDKNVGSKSFLLHWLDFHCRLASPHPSHRPSVRHSLATCRPTGTCDSGRAESVSLPLDSRIEAPFVF